MANVQAKKIDRDDFPKNPGEFSWRPSEENPTRMVICCPCGCGDVIGVNVKPERQFENGPEVPPWQWDGNRDKPTITPSIQVLSGCKWHGYLTNGEFTTC